MKALLPRGVTVVIVHPKGHAVGHGSDFSEVCPAGMSMVELQTNRATREAWQCAAAAYCGPDIAATLEPSNWHPITGIPNAVLNYLLSEKGFTEYVIRHSHEEEWVS